MKTEKKLELKIFFSHDGNYWEIFSIQCPLCADAEALAQAFSRPYKILIFLYCAVSEEYKYDLQQRKISADFKDHLLIQSAGKSI